MQYPVIGTFEPGNDDVVGGGVSKRSILPTEFAYFVVAGGSEALEEVDPQTVRQLWGKAAITVVDMRARSVPLRVEVKSTAYQFEATAKVVDAERVAGLQISDLNAAIETYVNEFEYPLSLLLDGRSDMSGAAIIARVLETELPEILGMSIILDAQAVSTENWTLDRMWRGAPRFEDVDGVHLSSYELRGIAKSFRGTSDSIGRMEQVIAYAGTDRLRGVSGAVWVSGDSGLEVRNALIGLFDDLDIGDVDLGPEIRGSWFQRFNGRLRAFMMQPDMVKITDEAKQRLDIELIEFRRAQLDALRVDTAAKLLASLDTHQEAVAMMGTLVVVKFGGQVVIRIVDALTAARIEGNNRLLSNPRAVLQILDGDLETRTNRYDGRGEIGRA
jgi:hypothetical protein